jgi:cytochrome c-type biogenesis protein CcmH
MIAFIILAAVLILAAAGAIAVPLLRGGGAGSRAPWTALGVVALLAIGAISLYLKLSNWSWAQARTAESGPRTMVSTLARRLWHHPNDVKGWVMLGRSYMVMQQTPLAVRAYERANTLTHGENVTVLLDLAEALSVEDESQLNGRAGKLIEKALALDPHSPEALFFGAAAAVHRGDLPLARSRFQSLLALNPPDSVKNLIEQQIAAIDQSLAAARSGGPLAQAGEPAAAIHITVALSPKLRETGTPSDAPLYVFVRDPNDPGPPLAVKRLKLRFPQHVELTSADAMIAGHGIEPGEKVEVVARISRSGSPIAQKGDPFGEVAYRVGRDGNVNVTIDRLTP